MPIFRGLREKEHPVGQEENQKNTAWLQSTAEMFDGEHHVHLAQMLLRKGLSKMKIGKFPLDLAT